MFTRLVHYPNKLFLILITLLHYEKSRDKSVTEVAFLTLLVIALKLSCVISAKKVYFVLLCGVKFATSFDAIIITQFALSVIDLIIRVSILNSSPPSLQ